MVSWVVLVMSGMCEAVWATALGKSEGLTKLLPSIVFVVGILASMGGLAYAMRTIPTSTAYAVWTGIGAALTTAYAMITRAEPVSLARIILIAILVACVVGLNTVH